MVISRRSMLGASLAMLAGCSRRSTAHEVVLYTSIDDYLVHDVKPILEHATSLAIRTVGDTEVTKTFGLVQRLLAEKPRPRADVWWSSEPFGTIQLARADVLESAPADLFDSWPGHLRSRDGTWLGLASRYRVIAYSAERVSAPPRTLRELAAWTTDARIGLARPEFGTTRGHMAALLDQWGEADFRRWLVELKARQVRLYDGNGAVVRAIALGEIDLGLTDSDDVFAAQRNDWAVDFVTEPLEPDGRSHRSFGAMLIPSTLALVKGRPHREPAELLFRAILSEEVALALAQSDSRNIPLGPAIAHQAGVQVPAETALLDLERVADRVGDSVRLCGEILTG